MALTVALRAGKLELQDLFRASPRALSAATARFQRASEDSPEPSKLLAGILYGRELIISYIVVIGSCTLLISAIHWWGEAVRWRARSANSEGRWVVGDGDISSGSSTIRGSASPPRKKDTHETAPLLGRRARSTPRTRLFSTLMAVLTYQPPPVPFVNKTLPSNGVSIFILAFLALNLFYLFFRIQLDLAEMVIFADRCGLVFIANLPLLYLLAAKTQPLKLLTGRSYESLNILHRRLGEWMCLVAVFHSAGMLYFWWVVLRPLGVDFWKLLASRNILMGMLAFGAYETLYFTSLASFRQRWYELFLGTHVVLQTATLVFLFLHFEYSRIYVGVSLAIFLVDRLLYRIGLKSVTVQATTEVMPDGETLKLSTSLVLRKRSTVTRIFGGSVMEGWQATDHIFISVPSLARKHIIQAHPFTICSSAPTQESSTARLELLIRAHDGFSADLLNRASHDDLLSVRLDGPYGSAHARNMTEDAELAILIAGGSGIAVLWPLVQHLLRSRSREAGSASSARPPRKIVLVWVVHKQAHFAWVDTAQLAELESQGVQLVIPAATEDVGRPRLDALIDGMVQEFVEAGGSRIGVVTSGPDSMGRTVRNACAKLMGDGYDIDVAVEKFGW